MFEERAGYWEWNYYWDTNPNAMQYIQPAGRLFIKEIIERLETLASCQLCLLWGIETFHDS